VENLETVNGDDLPGALIDDKKQTPGLEKSLLTRSLENFKTYATSN